MSLVCIRRDETGIVIPTVIVDNFNDNSLNTNLWQVGLITTTADESLFFTEADNKLRCVLDIGNVGSFNGIYSKITADFTVVDKNLVFRWMDWSSDAGAIQQVALAKDANTYIAFYKEGVALKYKKVVGGSVVLSGTTVTTASTSLNRWVRLARNSAGHIAVYTAPDSSGSPGTWTQRQQIGNNIGTNGGIIDLSTATVELSFGLTATPSGNHMVSFDDVEVKTTL